MHAVDGTNGLKTLNGALAMKNSVLSLIGLSALVSTAPAAAQYYPSNQNQSGSQSQYGNQANANLSTRIDQLRVRLQAGVQSGLITRVEAQPIRDQIRELSRLDQQYSVNGYSGQERAVLQQRIRQVRQQLRVVDNGANGRYNQWDADDAYSQGYQQPNQQGYNPGYQQPYNQGYQQGYQQPVQQGGIAGVVNQLLGVGGLQVGQRASGNLSGVPVQYQNQYRDGDGVYYRTDGRRIYQIDARSQTVVRVLPM
jgi:hypothetical protein